MEFEFDPAKDEANRFKHGFRLEFGLEVFDAEDHVILPSIAMRTAKSDTRQSDW